MKIDEVTKYRRRYLRQAIKDGCRITDDDLDRADFAPRTQTALLNQMAALGYTCGMDEDRRNVWWPPETEAATQ